MWCACFTWSKHGSSTLRRSVAWGINQRALNQQWRWEVCSFYVSYPGAKCSSYRRALLEVISIANLWVLSRLWSVLFLLVTLLVVPRNHGVSTPQLYLLGIYTPLQWSSLNSVSRIEINKARIKKKKGKNSLRENMWDIPYTCMCRAMSFMVYIWMMFVL